MNNVFLRIYRSISYDSGIKHETKRKRIRDFSKKIRSSVIFYYWVYEESGKRRFRTTGKKNYDEAVRYCRNLQIKCLLEPAHIFEEYTDFFFGYDDCPYINHRRMRGYTYSRTWAQKQKNLLERIIYPHFKQKRLKGTSKNPIKSPK